MNFEEITQFKEINNPFEMSYICENSGGYISKNKNIFDKIELNQLNTFILESAVYGTPIFKIGNKGNSILILSGIHGNELSSQVASLKAISKLLEAELKDTVYVIPFAAPASTMNNERNFNFEDLNRSSHKIGHLSNLIIRAIKKLNINFVGDFHTSALNSNPGKTAIFCSKTPMVESFLLATFMAQKVKCENIVFPHAGDLFKGAIEDECNLMGVPAITGETLSPFGSIAKGSIGISFFQMRAFLDYFGIKI